MKTSTNLESAYPERPGTRHGAMEEWCAGALAPLVRASGGRRLRVKEFIDRIAGMEPSLRASSSNALVEEARELGRSLRRTGFQPAAAARAFAIIREAAERTLGLRHFDVQMSGGWVLLNGMVAEMDTGEGKTLTATLPASIAALTGIPVHVITVNDYLARRDAEAMRPLYEFLGLTVGVVIQGMDSGERRKAYASDVTYCTNKELVFDYLKDRMVLGRRTGRLRLELERLSGESRLDRLLLRGLQFAIVDEADSILIDEARTPLILSGDGSTRTFDHTVYEIALQIAAKLEPGSDFLIDNARRRIDVTESGRARIAELAPRNSALWESPPVREDLVGKALSAQHLMQRERDYLVRDGKVQIIDEYTGRIMADRSWEQGLHQMIEARERCSLTMERDPVSRTSYQRFFRRYLRLAGMTGTAREVRGELWSIYRLPVIRVAPNRPPRRVNFGDRICATSEAKWNTVVARVFEMRARNRPVLIGTRSVAASEELSGVLRRAGIAHRILNARQDAHEAAIISQAGEPGRVTIATNMAGRGTDIRLTPDAARAGGLHVIGTERHEARRIDRQLFGRCGRQGEPGSYEMIVSLEDELFRKHSDGVFKLIAGMIRSGQPIGQWLGILAFGWIQCTTERLHGRVRRQLLRSEDQLQNALAFSGRFE